MERENKLYLIDTNIFLEVLLKRQHSPFCKDFLRKIASGQITGLFTSFSLHTIEIHMINAGLFKELNLFLESLLEYAGLRIYHTSVNDEIGILKAMESEGLTFDDATQFYVAKKFAAPIVSLDSDFDKTSIKRIDPAKANF